MENFQYYNYIFRLASDFQQGIHALCLQTAESKVESIARFLAAFNRHGKNFYNLGNSNKVTVMGRFSGWRITQDTRDLAPFPFPLRDF